MMKSTEVTFERSMQVNSPVQEEVNHPNHYQGKSMEVLDVIDDFGLNFSLGNVLKYVLRAGRKRPNKKLEDLQKAKFYLEHEIKKLKESS